MPTKGKLTTPELLVAQFLALGMPVSDAAERAEVDITWLRRQLEHPLFKAAIYEAQDRAYPSMTERLQKKLEAVQDQALSTMISLLDGETEPVQFRSAQFILEKGFLPPKPIVNVNNVHNGDKYTFNKDEITAILAGALNAGEHNIIAAFSAHQRESQQEENGREEQGQPEAPPYRIPTKPGRSPGRLGVIGGGGCPRPGPIFFLRR